MKTIKLCVLLSLISAAVFSQETWFHLYTDSISLTDDAHKISTQFFEDINTLNTTLSFTVNTVLNTTPGLIYYDDKTVNLPLWEQVIPQIKSFLYDMAGGEAEGKRVFELFFNGFYLPHELAHALQDKKEGSITGSYQNEYFANTVAILWWRKQGYNKELEDCYRNAKLILEKLTDPTPEGQTTEQYFTSNYIETANNPYSYGFLQFSQFVEIYDDTSLTDFNSYVKNYLNN